MKKIIIGLIGIGLIIGAFLLFNSKKIVEVQVDEQIALLHTYGFEAKEKEGSEDAKHFTVSLVDADKFVKHFPQYESFLKGDKKDFLKEFKFGVDVTSSGAIVSADIYPIAFAKDTLSQQEKDMLQKLIDKKALLLKINYNGVTQKINGTLKDIDESIKDVDLKVAGLNFDITNDDKKDIKFGVKNLNLSSHSSKEKFAIDATGISSKMSYEGLNYNVINGFMKFDKMLFDFNNSIVNAVDTNVEFITDVKDNLIDSGVKTTIKSIDADVDNKKIVLDNFVFDYGVNNIDLVSYDKLLKLLNVENPDFQSPQVTEIAEKLLSYGVGLDLNKFGVENITYDKESVKGFSVESKINISKDPSFLKNIQISPMLAMSAVEMKSKIELSDELFSLVMKDPNAMMLMMFKPKDENGQKVYEIDLKDGALSINDQPMM